MANIKKEEGVIGIDEVGRGPLAGPVTVGAAYLSDPKGAEFRIFNNTIRDSKKLTLSIRNNIFQTIRKNKKTNNILFAVSSRSAEHIDKYGINNSIHSCIISCLNSLEKQGVDVKSIKINMDGGLKIKQKNLKQEAFIKGDERFVEIAIASIIAKVTRDNYMFRLAKKLANYGFETNVGYGTLKHRNAIKKFGITKYHRKSYLKRF